MPFADETTTLMAGAVYGDFEETLKLMEQAQIDETNVIDPEMVWSTPICVSVGTALAMC